jgi:hypothetical protein
VARENLPSPGGRGPKRSVCSGSSATRESGSDLTYYLGAESLAWVLEGEGRAEEATRALEQVSRGGPPMDAEANWNPTGRPG